MGSHDELQKVEHLMGGSLLVCSLTSTQRLLLVSVSSVMALQDELVCFQ